MSDLPQLENGYAKIANALLDAECRVKMSGSEWQIYRFVQRKTYGWNKKSDAISITQFEDGTGLARQRVCEAIKALELRSMIVVTKNGLGRSNAYEIQKNFTRWKVVRKSGLVRKSGQSSTGKRTAGSHKKRTHNKQFKNKTKNSTALDVTNLPDGISHDGALNFIEHRKKLKAPLTQHALNLAMEEAAKAPRIGLTPVEAIDKTIQAGWKGINIDWLKKITGEKNGQGKHDTRSRSRRVADKLDEIARKDVEENGIAEFLDQRIV